MFGGPEVSYHQTYSARYWLSILRIRNPTRNVQRKHRTDFPTVLRKMIIFRLWIRCNSFFVLTLLCISQVINPGSHNFYSEHKFLILQPEYFGTCPQALDEYIYWNPLGLDSSQCPYYETTSDLSTLAILVKTQTVSLFSQRIKYMIG